MNQIRNYIIFGLLFVLGVSFIGCDKEESPTSASTKKPAAPEVSFTGPNTNSTNIYAQQAKSFSQMFNGFAAQFSAYSNMPGATQDGNVWTYTYTVQGFTETISVEVLGDGSGKWKIVFNGTEPGGTLTFVNWTVIEGTSSADGKSGSLKFYEENSTTLEAEISWTTDAQGNETGVIKTYTQGILNEQIDIVNNVDGSGSMKLYVKKSTTNVMYLNVDITWIANGTGTYFTYNESGADLGHGTF